MRKIYFFSIFLMSFLTGCKKDNPETIPLSPTELTAVVASESQIDLSWKDNSTNESGFTIERKTGAGSFAKIMTLTAGTTRYSDKGLQNYTRYSYRVNAFSVVGPSSAFTNEATATTGGVPVLNTKTISDTTSESATSGGNITNDGCSPIIGRGVVWNTLPAPTIDLATKTTDGSGTGTFTSQITGLSEKTKYYVRSYATNTAGTGYGEEIVFVTKSLESQDTVVYATGIGFVWKNGILTSMEYNSKAITGNSVFAKGSDVYVAGNAEPSAALLWKNGAVTVLSSVVSAANSVFVSGGDIYVAGWQQVNNRQTATLWKNNQAQILPGSTGNTYHSANAVFVSGTDVYVAGLENVGGIESAVLWKNGVVTVLSDGQHLARAHSVFVDGNDVYVAGQVVNDHNNSVATYWKNGVVYSLTDGTNTAYASSIFVYGNDIYVAGAESLASRLMARLWKNGVSTNYVNTVPYGGDARSVFVLGTDVYVAGVNRQGTLAMPIVWKNGQAIILSPTQSSANSVFVAK